MTEPSALGKVLNQKYRLAAELGRGAMGIVYRAEQLDVKGQMQRLVALKTMTAELSANSDFARRFLQEIRITMTLNHPHIVAVYDSGRDEGGQLYFTMELVQGQTLRALLRREGHYQSSARCTSLSNSVKRWPKRIVLPNRLFTGISNPRTSSWLSAKVRSGSRLGILASPRS
jgi:serine/threonine protein kinase